jgi:two-component system CheB/CheR fusion protein
LSKFFQGVAADSGMAFVVIQHLPPDQTTLMPEILARHSALPVKLISDAMAVEPNTVYVIRPGFTVTLEDGLLRLGEPVQKRGHRRPVDDFFRSLALEQQAKAIVVVLSGTGTNGTAGAQAVKAAGGLCIAQEPESAEFPGMPRSLIQSGYADEVLAPERIPALLTRFARRSPGETVCLGGNTRTAAPPYWSRLPRLPQAHCAATHRTAHGRHWRDRSRRVCASPAR